MTKTVGVCLLGMAATACAGDAGDATPSEDVVYAQELWDRFGADSAWVAWETLPEGLTNPDDLYESGDHSGAWVLSYADPIAQDSLDAWTGTMAEDGLLVKAQYASQAGGTPGGFTAMVKRAGYDPDHGDWFWASYGGDGTVNDAGAIGACYGCHGAGGQDYIRTPF